MLWRFVVAILLSFEVPLPAVAQVPAEKNPLVQLSSTIRALTRRTSPAVVEVHVVGYRTGDEDTARGVSQTSRQRSSGSGVIVDPAGYIMTDAHVVQGAVQVKVVVTAAGSLKAAETGHSTTRTLEARILGIDRDSDLALLHIEAQDLPVLHFGNSDALRQGDLVLAIGSPLGLHNSVSMGVVSAPARAINDDNPILYIQTDASINPGNSGGALLDTHGLLIGLNTFIVSQSGGNEGIGFAIPSNVVRNVYEQLRKKGKVSRGSVGLFVQNISRSMAKGLSLTLEEGVVIADVQPEGPGDRAGLKRRDIILNVNGARTDSARQFGDAIFRRQGGEKLTFVIQRGDSRLNVPVEVTEQPEPWDPLAALASPEKNLVPRLGILCIEIDKKVAEMLPDLRRTYGLIVAAKSSEGPGQAIDLQPGDVIHAVNNIPMSSLPVFQTQIEQLPRRESVALQIERDGHFQYVAFDID